MLNTSVCFSGTVNIKQWEVYKPVKEGGQQPPQQNFVSGPRANVAVHQLGSGYIHRSTCEEHQRGKPPLLVASIVQAHHSEI